MPAQIRKNALTQWIAPLCVLLVLGFLFYLWFLFQQLEVAFNKTEEFTPTRIYSDVSKIAPSQTRSSVLSKLDVLAYPYKLNGNWIVFSLRPIQYPDYLLPDNHPTFSIRSSPITLSFDGKGPRSTLTSIEVEGKEIPEFYVEPELVTTWSRTLGQQSHGEIRVHIQFKDIPPQVWKSIIAIEDQHFLEHNGLDPRGLFRALWVNLKTFSLAQGGSTITQQLVKNLLERKKKNIFRKVNEIFLALILEAKFDKEQILERYLNEVYLGQSGSLEVHGIAEGAKSFFGKRVDQLNLAETALIAGLIRGPAFYSPYRHKERALKRQHLVLEKMVETGQIADAEAQAALHQQIRLAPPQTVSNKAPHFTDFVKAELIRELKARLSEQEIADASFRVYTTLDLGLNRLAQQAVSVGVTRLEKQMMGAGARLEGALAVVDHANGYIRALIGSKNYEQSNFNRILNMKRQVGSTFKPIVYLAAIHKGVNVHGITYGPAMPVEDSPFTIRYDHDRESWSPHNYEKDYRGWIPLREAFVNSINTVAARIGADVGIDAITKTARALGIESDLPAIPSLTLGSVELSPVELLRVYSTLANHGTRDELTVIRGITMENGNNYARFIYNPTQVLDPAEGELITYLMQGVFTEGTAEPALKMGFDRPAAGKTGTTNDYRDSWFAGFTPQLTAVAWVGLDQGSAAELPTNPKKKSKHLRFRLTGASGALPIWVDFMNRALEGVPPTPFPPTEHLVDLRINRYSGKKAPLSCPDQNVVIEKYLSGKEPREEACDTQWPSTESEGTFQ